MKKRYFCWVLMFLASVSFGYFLGNLDFFGFLDGRHEVSLKFLIGTILSSYFTTLIAIFVDRIENGHPAVIFSVATFFFVSMFALANGSIIASIFSGILFLMYIFIVSNEAEKRFELYVRFVPSELFFPVIKKGFLFILGMFAIISFFQSRYLVENNSLVSPALVKSVSKPLILVLNKQLETQLHNQLGDSLGPTENTAAKRQVVEFVLKSTIKTTFGKQGAKFGFNPETAPVDKVIIHDDGAIDVAPVISAMSDDISASLNLWILPYIYLAPFVIALAVILIFQPLMWPIEMVATGLSRLIFFVLFKLKFVSIRKETREVERLTF